MPVRKASPTELEKFWENPAYRTAIYALQAVQRGTASPEQQQLAIDFIVGSLCGYPGVAFDPSSSWMTAFLAGKQVIGRHIAMLVYADVPAMVERLKVLERQRKDG